MKTTIWFAWLFFMGCSLSAQEAEPPRNVGTVEERSKKLLERFPEADTNQDGTLSREEFRAFVSKRRSNEAPSMPERPGGRPKVTPPTHADVAYGDHDKQRFDLWMVPGAA
ncbi:MAG: hypothetical protein AAF357_19395, partial [Verrucomicrobiota bacterium]